MTVSVSYILIPNQTIVNRLAKGGSHVAKDKIPVEAANTSTACLLSSVIKCSPINLGQRKKTSTEESFLNLQDF